MHWLKSLFLIITLGLTSYPSMGQEDEAVQPQAYSGKQDQQWEVVQNELAGLKIKVDSQEALVESLVEQKSKLKGDALLQLVNDIKREHRKYQDLVLEYNKKNDEFLTRYPERGLKEKRVYTRAKMKSLKGFENQVSLKKRMEQVHDKVLRQYPGVVESARSPEQGANSRKSREQKVKTKNSKDVTEPIQFKK